MHRPTILERAFQLAREGVSMSELRKTLRREGYEQVQEQLASRVLWRQLRAAGAISDKQKAAPAQEGDENAVKPHGEKTAPPT